MNGSKLLGIDGKALIVTLNPVVFIRNGHVRSEGPVLLHNCVTLQSNHSFDEMSGRVFGRNECDYISSGDLTAIDILHVHPVIALVGVRV